MLSGVPYSRIRPRGRRAASLFRTDAFPLHAMLPFNTFSLACLSAQHGRLVLPPLISSPPIAPFLLSSPFYQLAPPSSHISSHSQRSLGAFVVVPRDQSFTPSIPSLPPSACPSVSFCPTSHSSTHSVRRDDGGERGRHVAGHTRLHR
jgi:hypothetical protein